MGLRARWGALCGQAAARGQGVFGSAAGRHAPRARHHDGPAPLEPGAHARHRQRPRAARVSIRPRAARDLAARAAARRRRVQGVTHVARLAPLDCERRGQGHCVPAITSTCSTASSRQATCCSRTRAWPRWPTSVRPPTARPRPPPPPSSWPL